ncbi:O-acetyl-ADP-ribose deacetylase [Tahibacter amnicola]|uniref:O-acetyl-ADP-ribose deacetylase n=1 Tax=Tahibacter amnicola TaxID=2976241 RepID=A0ABY6BJW7_9GAMM|nr:O-acetyl-ADP-ribose deacetylase [Tahibacter amnicola]UXI68891.1 O-acetyl-ADP-ribose deacetylase [Tahibacter amnicola]
MTDPARMEPVLEVVEGDITRLAVDAIVNAANESLTGGGGVDGAIHRAAGRALLEECLAIPQVRPHVRCPTGEARLTGGHRLPARHVIHTVGPVWYGGDKGEPALLAACYAQRLRLAQANDIRTIAFPAISCGVFGYPLDAATRVAIETIHVETLQPTGIARIYFCAFSKDVAAAYQRALSALGTARSV